MNCTGRTETPYVHKESGNHRSGRAGLDARGPVVAEVALRRYQDGSLEFVRIGDVSSLDLTQARFAA